MCFQGENGELPFMLLPSNKRSIFLNKTTISRTTGTKKNI